MKARLLDLCLLAYPRDQRRRDGDVLRDLAWELSADRGLRREAASLLLGGAVARFERVRTNRAVVRRLRSGGIAAAVLATVTVLGGQALAAGGPVHVDEDVFTCSGSADCARTATAVETREQAGWTCAEGRAPAAVSTWRCTLERSG